MRPPAAEYFTVGEILAKASSARPEPFGSELKAELLTAEGSRPTKGGTIVRVQQL